MDFFVRHAAVAMLCFAMAASAAEPENNDNPLSQIWQGIKQGVNQATDGKGVAGKISDDVQDNLAGKVPQVVGHVNLGNGAYMTYFDNNKMGFPSRGAPLSVPPRPGTVPPPMMLAPTGRFEGVLIPNNIDEATKAGLFIPAAAGTGAAGFAAGSGAIARERVEAKELQLSDGTWYRNDEYNCSKVWHLDTNRNPLATIRPGSNAAFSLIAACETATNEKNFRKIRPAGSSDAGSAAAPAPAPAPVAAVSDDDLAEQGAKACNLKPVQVFKLKEKALQFVRYDRKAEWVVMSDWVDGARREIVLDDKAFAQRSAALAHDVGAGGEVCGRAFWGNEAIKAATAAFSAK